jgi:C-terminal processing protease CtpA/Prc
MQTTYTMPGGGALHISTSQYLTKNRVSLHDAGGLVPDHQVTLTDEELTLLISGDLEMDADPQIQRALLILKQNK